MAVIHPSLETCTFKTSSWAGVVLCIPFLRGGISFGEMPTILWRRGLLETPTTRGASGDTHCSYSRKVGGHGFLAGARTTSAHNRAYCLHHPCRMRGPHCLKVGELAHQRAHWLHHSCRLGGSPAFQSSGQNETWPTNGRIGFITPAVEGGPQRFNARGKMRRGPQMGVLPTSPLPSRDVPNTSTRGTKSEVAHKWTNWLHHPCRLGGSPTLQSGGQNQRWPTNGRIGYITHAV